MARRSDHSREELERMIVIEGYRHMAEVGFAHFSAREVAKRIGYSIGTLYNVFGSYDRLVFAINTRTFQLWADDMRARLDGVAQDRIGVLVSGYFAFAQANRNVWTAIYDHHMPPDEIVPDAQNAQRGALTDIVVQEIAAVLPRHSKAEAARLARSLVATVHGHCTFALNGSFALMGETRPLDLALARVREALAAAGS